MSGFGCEFYMESEESQYNYGDQSQQLFGYGPCSVLPSTLISSTSYFTQLPPVPATEFQWPATSSNDSDVNESSKLFLNPSQQPEMKDSRKRRSETHCADADNRDTVFPDEFRGASPSTKKKTIERPTADVRPPFKVLSSGGRRSQKLSDKITALQKVVSPYGKTDTASVLQETCMYIKMAHQEIRRLSISYYGVIRSLQHYHQFNLLVHNNNNNNTGVLRKQHDKPLLDLRSRGLCLVPLSITKLLLTDDHNSNETNPTSQGVVSSSSRSTRRL